MKITAIAGILVTLFLLGGCMCMLPGDHSTHSTESKQLPAEEGSSGHSH